MVPGDCVCVDLFTVSSALEADIIMNGFSHDHFQTVGVVFSILLLSLLE